MFAPKARSGRVAKWLLAGALAVGSLLSPLGVRSAAAETYVNVRVGPPPARVEVIPARPSPRHVWVHGYWAWQGHHHAWVPGHYVVARPGFVYAEPRWEQRGHGYRYHRGGWHRR